MDYTGSPLSIIVSTKKSDNDIIQEIQSTTEEVSADTRLTNQTVSTNNVDNSSQSVKFGNYSIKNGYVQSIFNQNVFSVNPTYESNGNVNGYMNNFYDDSTYNYTYNQLIDWTNNPKNKSMRLRPSDFAFLKYRGVYPPNRLIIVRRFISGVSDDLTRVDQEPVSTIVSFMPENENFIECDFGEEWDRATDSFKSLINDIGNDLTFNSSDNKGKRWGDFAGGLGGLVPMPGLTENFQYRVLKKMGWTDLDPSLLPHGNPNLIREAMMRKTLGTEGGSTLMARFRIKVETEYQIEYYPNVDPTLAYMDVLANILSFSTSESVFQLNPTASEHMTKFLQDISSGSPSRIKDAILRFITATAKTIAEMATELIDKISGILIETQERAKRANEIANNENMGAVEKTRFVASEALNPTIQTVTNITASVLQTVINKYKVKLIGVIHSLTGQPSTEWHVTIGNPKKPIFSSGDMYLHSGMTLELGNTLGFNDLPTSIKISFTLINARNLGSQEIFRKFNCGKSRTYVKIGKSFIENSNAVKVTQQEADRMSKEIKSVLPSNNNPTPATTTVRPITATNTNTTNTGAGSNMIDYIQRNGTLPQTFGGGTTEPFKFKKN